MIIYNCFVSEDYKQLQQGRSSVFLMVGWESHPRQKSLEIQNLGWEILKVGEIGIKQILKQRVYFRISVAMRNTYQLLNI